MHVCVFIEPYELQTNGFAEFIWLNVCTLYAYLLIKLSEL